MGEETKKISFGFSKLVKKTSIVSSKLNQIKPEENKVEFIRCLEGNAIKLKDAVQTKDTPLVIPLKRPEIISRTNQIKSNQHTAESTTGNNITETYDCSIQNLDKPDTLCRPTSQNNVSQGSNEHQECAVTKETIQCETLDEIAAREILEELNKNKTNEGETKVFSVPLTSNPPTGEQESTIDDYDNIPVTSFGMAMLRGMGWAPGKGIGKTEKLVTPSMPTLRPKGMGLGADKMLKSESSKNVEEDLKMAKGSFIRVIAGSYKGSYGQIEGFDDESGRLIAKLVLKNISVSLNEFMVQLVNKGEFTKNSKVINMGKYLQYKDEENKTSDKIQTGPNMKQSSDRPKAKIKLNDMNEENNEGNQGVKLNLTREKHYKEYENASETAEKYRKKHRSRSPSVSDSRSRSTQKQLSVKDSTTSRHHRMNSSSCEDRSPSNPTRGYKSGRKKEESRSYKHPSKKSASSSSSEDSRTDKKFSGKESRSRQQYSKIECNSSREDSRLEKTKIKKSANKCQTRSSSNSSVEHSRKNKTNRDENLARSYKHRTSSESSSSPHRYSKLDIRLKKKSYSHKREPRSRSQSPVRTHKKHKSHKKHKVRK